MFQLRIWPRVSPVTNVTISNTITTILLQYVKYVIVNNFLFNIFFEFIVVLKCLILTSLSLNHRSDL